MMCFFLCLVAFALSIDVSRDFRSYSIAFRSPVVRPRGVMKVFLSFSD